MSLLDDIENWLATTGGDFELAMGDWRTMEYSTGARYVAYQLTGGRSPMAGGVRGTMVLVNIVGAQEIVRNDGGNWVPPSADELELNNQSRADELVRIYSEAEMMLTKTDIGFTTGCLIQVNAIGDIIGPAHTDRDRSVVALTLEFIH